MVVAIATPVSEIELVPGSAIRLKDVSWHDYEGLLQVLSHQRSTRIAYSYGVLEIRMPSQLHEVVNRLLAAIILALAEELDLDLNNLGSATLNRPDLSRGIEPDSCFFIQNAQAGQGIEAVVTVPPDLAIEVDIANSSDNKLPIYAAMGVPELWLYQHNKITIQLLQNNNCYQSQEYSLAFPPISATQLNEWIAQRQNSTDLSVIKTVRKAVSQQQN